MLKKIKYSDKDYEKNINKHIDKSVLNLSEKTSMVANILKDVKKNGNKALLKYIKEFENEEINN